MAFRLYTVYSIGCLCISGAAVYEGDWPLSPIKYVTRVHCLDPRPHCPPPPPPPSPSPALKKTRPPFQKHDTDQVSILAFWNSFLSAKSKYVFAK